MLKNTAFKKIETHFINVSNNIMQTWFKLFPYIKLFEFYLFLFYLTLQFH